MNRVWHIVETTDLDVSDASSHVKEHLDRHEKLEVASEEARLLRVHPHAGGQPHGRGRHSGHRAGGTSYEYRTVWWRMRGSNPRSPP